MICIVYVIADVHLSLSVGKPMSVFGSEWNQHEQQISKCWCDRVKESDTVFLPGDISWGIDFHESLADFAFLHRLPGKKIISKGNHDYWWSTVGKMKKELKKNQLTSIDFLHNNAYLIEGKVFCGTKGYIFDDGISKAQNQKIQDRERMRLELSLQEGQKLANMQQDQTEMIVLLHYPPITKQQRNDDLLDLMRQYRIRRCYYGHIHGAGKKSAVTGDFEGLELALVSADFLSFSPLIVK